MRSCWPTPPSETSVTAKSCSDPGQNAKCSRLAECVRFSPLVTGSPRSRHFALETGGDIGKHLKPSSSCERRRFTRSFDEEFGDRAKLALLHGDYSDRCVGNWQFDRHNFQARICGAR